jgi:hypothetical protein
MGRGLVREINAYLQGLKGNKDWQRSRIYDIDYELYKSQTSIIPVESNAIVKKLENHWKILVNQIYPEFTFYNDGTMGESWPVAKKACAINIPLQNLKPCTVVHEVSHGISECAKTFHSPGLREPGHGPMWCGIYAYNLNLVLGIDIRDKMNDNGIRSISEETVLKIRKHFTN